MEPTLGQKRMEIKVSPTYHETLFPTTVKMMRVTRIMFLCIGFHMSNMASDPLLARPRLTHY